MAKTQSTRKRDRKRKVAKQLLAEQARIAIALESLAVAVHAQSPPSEVQLLDEIRKLLDDVLVAQHRTNQLLELALRAGFDDEERARES